MAARTFETNAEKDLTHRRGEILRLPPMPKHHGRAMPVGAPAGNQQITRELIVRLVLAEAIANPLVKHVDALHTHPVGIRTEEINPRDCPVIGPRGMLK